MKVCFFIGSLWSGGAERVISRLANHYFSQGNEVEIVLLLNPSVNQKVFDGIKIINIIGNQERSYYSRIPFWIKEIRKHVKHSKPDIIISFVGRINVLVLLSCLGLKTPIIISERNDPRHDGRSKIMLKACNFMYRFSTRIVFQTEYERTAFSKKLSKKSIIIVNPVSIETTDNQIKKEKTIISVGRLVAQKNQKLLIDAFALAHKLFPEYKLKIFGDGELKEALGNEIAALGLCESIFLCGNVSNVPEELQKASLFVMTSNYEGLSNALIEALMVGLPCISTMYGGIEEIIKDGVNGIIVNSNDVNSVSEAIIDVLSDSKKRELLSKNALLSSKKYNQEEVYKEWDKLIEEIIKS